MKRKIILGTFAIVAIVSATIFLNVVSAQSEGKTSRNRTPASPAASTTLVISEVYGAGGNTGATYTTDYVEIKNISGTTQSLNGLGLQYGSATTGQFGGSTGTNIATLPNASIAPGQYFLVGMASGANGVALPVTPDFTAAAINMSGSSGKIALTTTNVWLNCGGTIACTFPNANIIDWVAYGAAGNVTAGNGEGGTAVNGGVALTATQGAVRKGGGCTDTDNNNLDFDVLSPPVPRNTTTTAAPCGAVSPTQHVLDFNGDGKTDWSVVRNTGGGLSGQMTWFNCYNGVAEPGCYQFLDWGIASDRFVPADYDGDGKTDIAIWRPAAAGTAGFYILQSGSNTVRYDNFGQTGDNPSVVADYTGDGKADPAVYRAGANAGDQSFWYYRASSGAFSGSIVYEQWGQNGDFVAPGDYDGDGKADFMIQRNAGGGQAIFWLRTNTTNNISNYVFGTPTDVIVPGDYDGDGKTDIATVRGSGGSIVWFYRASSTGNLVYLGAFGLSATDFPVQGDYDGDGKTDIAVWRPAVDSGANYFHALGTTSGYKFYEWGQNGDYPVANYNSH